MGTLTEETAQVLGAVGVGGALVLVLLLGGLPLLVHLDVLLTLEAGRSVSALFLM